MRLSTDDVHCLEALAAEGSFTGAASKLGCSQAAVSKAIKRLEHQFGCVVVDRAEVPYRLTTAGHGVLGSLTKAVQHVDAAVMIGQNDRPADRALRVGCLPSLSTWMVSSLGAWFSSGQLTTLVEAHQARLERQLEQGAIDLAVGDLTAPPEHTRVRRLFSDPFVVCCAPSNRLARRRSVRIEDLSGHTLIRLATDAGAARTVDAYLRAQGIDVRRAAMVSSFPALFGLVAADAGITVVPLVATGLSQGVAVRPISGQPLRRPIGVMTRRGRSGRDFAAIVGQLATISPPVGADRS